MTCVTLGLMPGTHFLSTWSFSFCLKLLLAGGTRRVVDFAELGDTRRRRRRGDGDVVLDDVDRHPFEADADGVHRVLDELLALRWTLAWHVLRLVSGGGTARAVVIDRNTNPTETVSRHRTGFI